MRTYYYTIENKEEWRITDTEIVIIADTKNQAIRMLKNKGYHNIDSKLVTRMTKGVHIIQQEITE